MGYSLRFIFVAVVVALLCRCGNLRCGCDGRSGDAGVTLIVLGEVINGYG